MKKFVVLSVLVCVAAFAQDQGRVGSNAAAVARPRLAVDTFPLAVLLPREPPSLRAVRPYRVSSSPMRRLRTTSPCIRKVIRTSRTLTPRTAGGSDMTAAQRCALPHRSAVVARTLRRRLWAAACIRACGRKPGALLVWQLLLGRRTIRLQHRRWLELGRRSDRDLRGSRPRRLVSRLQPAVRDVRSRRVPGWLTAPPSNSLAQPVHPRPRAWRTASGLFSLARVRRRGCVCPAEFSRQFRSTAIPAFRVAIPA